MKKPAPKKYRCTLCKKRVLAKDVTSGGRHGWECGGLVYVDSSALRKALK